MRKYIGFLVIIVLLFAPHVFAQNTRVDGTAFSRSGLPAPGALVAVCSQPAITAISESGNTVTVTSTLNPPQGATVQIFDVTPSAYNGNFTVLTSSPTSYTFTHPVSGLLPGTVFGANVITGTTAAPTGPCAPVVGLCASVADAACLQPNPATADGLGNYFFYIPAGLYTYEIFGSVLTTKVLPDQNVGSPAAGSGFVNACSGNNCDAYFPVATVPSVFGDPLATDDGSGNKQAKSYRFTDNAHSGFWNEDAGPALPTLADLHSMYFSINPSFGTTYGLEPWDSIPTVGDCINIAAGDATGWVKLHDTGNACGVGGGTTIATPNAPTLAVGGTPGAATVCYQVVALEDTNSALSAPDGHHTGPSLQTCTNTANATLSLSPITLSAYGDTLYGARCFTIYRVTGGPSQGKIAVCVDKKFTDNGLAGDSTTPPASNTTSLIVSYDAVHNCNTVPDAPRGVDGPPCTPTTDDDEFGNIFGAPGDANNPRYTWVNQNSATSKWSGGELVLTAPDRSNANSLNCLSYPAPATPYIFKALLWYNQLTNGTNSDQGTGATGSGFGLSDGTKYTLVGLASNSTTGNGHGRTAVGKWTNTTTASSAPAISTYGSENTYIGVAVQDDGTNVAYYTSSDNVTWIKQFTELRGAFFTTAPNVIVFCVDNSSQANFVGLDYVRKQTSLP